MYCVATVLCLLVLSHVPCVLPLLVQHQFCFCFCAFYYQCLRQLQAKDAVNAATDKATEVYHQAKDTVLGQVSLGLNLLARESYDQKRKWGRCAAILSLRCGPGVLLVRCWLSVLCGQGSTAELLPLDPTCTIVLFRVFD